MELKVKHIADVWDEGSIIDTYAIDFFIMNHESLLMEVMDNKAATMTKPEWQWQFEYHHGDEEDIIVRINFAEDDNNEWRMQFGKDEIESIVATEDILQISLLDGQCSVFSAEGWQWEIGYVADSYLAEED